MMEDLSTPRRRSKCESFRDWIGSPSFYIYINYILGAWGDWMWQFAVGLFLVKLSGGVLRLAAIYGFCGGGAVLLFGGVIGNWIDRNRRKKVMVTTLGLQNMSVMLSASAVCATLFYADFINSQEGLRVVCEAVIVAMAILAQLSSVGYKIAIEKDWIVVIAAGNSTFLANLNAVTRAIDLSCKILAPCCVGLVMTWWSDAYAALLIAVWNLVSVFVELALLHKVYSLVPALAVKSTVLTDTVVAANEEDEKQVSLDPTGGVGEEMSGYTEEGVDRQESTQPLRPTSAASKDKQDQGCLRTMFEPVIALARGWVTYARQSVVFAGLSLACLYMTVLGFDSITTGYIYASGVREYLVAMSMGLAGVAGILGTLCFTLVRRRLGLERTGLIAFGAEIACLSLCVASLFTPGTTFEPFHINQCHPALNQSHQRLNGTSEAENIAIHDVAKRSIGQMSFNDEDGLYKHIMKLDDVYGATLDSGVENVAFIGLSGSQHGELLSIYSSNPNFNEYRRLVLSGRSKRDVLSREREISDHSTAAYYHSYSGHVFVTRRDADSLSYSPTNNSGVDLVTLDGSDGTRIRVERQEFDDVDCVVESEGDWTRYISSTLFLVGIVTSRVGLWMADLVVTQLLQENVIESERGVVNGVQNSLNMLLDMLKFTLVILVPHIHHFGYLILASFVFICFAGGLFAHHARRVRRKAPTGNGLAEKESVLANGRKEDPALEPMIVHTNGRKGDAV